MSFEIKNIVRKNIFNLAPYSSARDDFSGNASIFIDANENSLGSPVVGDYSRYPDPHQRILKQKMATIKRVPAANIFLGNGSDECIDVLYRAFCNPGKDNVIICPPTYGMYEVSANINDVEVRKSLLTTDFQLNVEDVLSKVDANTKLIWICSPNNPSGNLLHEADIDFLLQNFSTGIVVVDEAYIDFADQVSFSQKLAKFPQLVVLQTFSKSWGLAGLRLGIAFASEAILSILNKIKPPYNINQETQRIALDALQNEALANARTKELLDLRLQLTTSLEQLTIVKKIFPSDANFLLVQFDDPQLIYNILMENGIIVRDRHSVILCEGCLRITVGSAEENQKMVEVLSKL